MNNFKKIACGVFKAVSLIVSVIELYEFGNSMCQKYSQKTKGVSSPDLAVEPTDNAENA